MDFYACSCFRFPVGPVVGGIIGGLVAIAVIVFVLKFRRKTPSPEEFDTTIHTTPFDPDDARPQASQPDMTHVPVSSLYSTTLYPGQASNNIPPRQNSNASPSADFFTPIDAANLDSERHGLSPSQGKDTNFGGATFSPGPDFLDDEIVPNQLTNEQAAYVQSMYSHNVPVPAMAVVVERMLQEGRRTGESSIGSAGVRRGHTTATMPPSYVNS